MEELGQVGVATDEPKPAATTQVLNPTGRQMVPAVHRLTTMEKVMAVVRAAVPIAQKMLPLIDGHVGTAVSNLIGPPGPQREDARVLGSIQDGLAQLEKRHLELRTQLAGQGVALKQIEEQLELVKKLGEDTAEECRDLTERLDKLGRKLGMISVLTGVLLVAVVALSVLIFANGKRVLP